MPEEIIALIRSHYFGLPDRIAERQRQSRNRYMRDYMRNVYRKDHPSLSVTLTAAEHRRIRSEAKTSGRKPAAFLREAAFAYLDKRYLVPERLEQSLHTLTNHLAALGNNLNQIAKHANTQRRASADDLKTARSLLERAESLITDFVTAPAEAPHSALSHPSDGDQVDEP